MPVCIDDFEQGGHNGYATRVSFGFSTTRAAKTMSSSAGNIADGDDIDLWKVVAVRTSTSSLVEMFEPGNVPAGYRETVPLDMPGQGDEVVIYLVMRRVEIVVSVRLGDLCAGHPVDR